MFQLLISGGKDIIAGDPAKKILDDVLKRFKEALGGTDLHVEGPDDNGLVIEGRPRRPASDYVFQYGHELARRLKKLDDTVHLSGFYQGPEGNLRVTDPAT